MIDDKITIRKNNLINAKIRLKANEYDLIRSFISQIDRINSEFWTISISAKDLNLNYSRAKSMIRAIGRNPVEIDNGYDQFISIPWFRILKYEKGVFTASFNTELNDMLLQIKGDYTKTFEKYILPMDSMYAKRLYELLSEFKKIGYRKFLLKDLQDILQVAKSQYAYSKFKEKVLEIAIREINLHTDIFLDIYTKEDWKKLQCGKLRGITHLNFSILTNPKNIDKDKIILEWIEKVREHYKNKKLMSYSKNDLLGFISVNKNGRLYMQDEIGNSMGIDIKKDRAWELWKYMFNNKDKTLIQV